MMNRTSSSAAELLAHEAFVARLARSLAADEAAAEDLAQETWLAALEGNPCREPGLRSWLASVLRNLAVSGLRSRQRRAQRERACARPERQPDTNDLVERVELHHQLVAAVLKMPAAYREVILRHYLLGESVRALAEALGQPEATVRTRLRRARERLREELRGRFFGDHSGALLAALATLDSATSWTSDWIMKKTLFQTPLLVVGLLGAGLGFSGSLLVRPVPAAEGPSQVSLGEPPTRATNAIRSSADSEPELGALSAAPSLSSQRELAASSSADIGFASEDELRRLLRSSDRLDQVRAIRFLLAEGTPAAHGLLLEAFLTTSDAILMAMLEEALLRADVDVAPAVLEAYRSSSDPVRLARLTSMMAELLERDAGLEPAVIELLLGALRDPGPHGERLAGLDALLAAMGTRALDALAQFLADPLAAPAGVSVAVAALRSLDPRASERVRKRLGEVFDALVAAVGDPALSAEQRQALRERTSSVAWAAGGRPPQEHDEFGEMLSAFLFRSADVQQAQTLAWGLSNLDGLSEGTRARLSRSILQALHDQPDQDLRQTYLWAVSQLVTDQGTRPLDQEFFDVWQQVEDAIRTVGDPAIAAHLRWLMHELEKHREEKER